MMSLVRSLSVILVIILMSSLFISLGCVAPPKGDVRPSSTTIGATPSTTQTVVGTQPSEQPTITPTSSVAPFVTIETPKSLSTQGNYVNQTPTPTQILYSYVNVYSVNQVFRYNSTAISMDLANPPLIINFAVTPVMTTDSIWFVSRNLSHDEVTQTVITPSPYAYFKVTVSDKKTGLIVAEDGYLKEFSSDTAKTIKVMKAGLYRVDFSGNDVTVDIDISVKDQGNLVNVTG